MSLRPAPPGFESEKTRKASCEPATRPRSVTSELVCAAALWTRRSRSFCDADVPATRAIRGAQRRASCVRSSSFWAIRRSWSGGQT
jgi:hypothetical protein